MRREAPSAVAFVALASNLLGQPPLGDGKGRGEPEAGNCPAACQNGGGTWPDSTTARTDDIVAATAGRGGCDAGSAGRGCLRAHTLAEGMKDSRNAECGGSTPLWIAACARGSNAIE